MLDAFVVDQGVCGDARGDRDPECRAGTTTIRTPEAEPSDEEHAETDEADTGGLTGSDTGTQQHYAEDQHEDRGHPRAIGYTTDTSAWRYADASRTKYVSCSTAVTAT